MKLFHVNNDKLKLLIFFCGFYTDPECFIEFDNGSSDILFVYDYSTLNSGELEYFDFSIYTEINLIAYSYGVFGANESYRALPEINNSVAISGTIYPIDEFFGIKPKIYDLMLNSFNEEVIKNFKAKMEIDSGTIKNSKRTVENLKNFKFDKVIITKKDRIIPYSSQKNFWELHNNIEEINCGHFPFFNYKDFDEILEI